MAYLASPVQPNVTVGNFAIDAYEVTVARFNAYWSVRAAEMATVRASPIRYRGGMIAWQPAPNAEPLRQSSQSNWLPTSSTRDAHPMNGVDYWMAQEFCVWDGARLPTEAEWEYAARGSAGRVYPWGDTAPGASCDRAQWNNCAGTDGASTRRVGSFPTGAAGGVFDLAGNVWEWLADNYASYSSGGAADSCANRSGTINPLGNNNAAGIRVEHGGWWGDYVVGAPLRSATRLSNTPAARGSAIGFRCARDMP